MTPLYWYGHQFKGKPWWRKLIAGILSFIIFFFLFLLAIDNNFLFLF